MKYQSDNIEWNIEKVTPLLHTPVFDVQSQKETAGSVSGDYVSIQAPDWVMTIPILNDTFVMVRQWRHGLRAVTTEFPGGVAEPDETPEMCSARELLEETGFKAGKITYLGCCNPNPALFSNRIHFCLAEELEQTGELHLDDDELLKPMQVPVKEVFRSFGNGEYFHALTGTALTFYARCKGLF